MWSGFYGFSVRGEVASVNSTRFLICMYLLTIRDGLQTRHIGPYDSPARAVEDLDALLGSGAERARWQIHELESPANTGIKPDNTDAAAGREQRPSALAA